MSFLTRRSKHREPQYADDLRLANYPLKVLCELGGWKNAHTFLKCYQRTVSDSYLFVTASLTDFVDPV
ncbi:MAG: hypothetical protein OXI46_05370, partial [Gemmatimonadota bacterium]|nr:hypothetical protein [Gemmatimonadota bacterium]